MITKTPTAMEQTGLLDVLPLQVTPPGDELRRQRFSLSTDGSLGAALRERGVTAGDVLVAALALVESRLTGADGVLATRITGADISQCVVDPASRDRLAAAHAPSGHMPWEPAPTPLAATPPRTVAWAVLDDDTPPVALQDWAVSIWQLREGSPPWIEVSYHPSLGDDAVGMLGASVQLAVASWIAGDEVQDLLDPDERQRQLVDWNRTTRSRPPYPTVQGMFAAMRDASPSAVAVVDGDTSLTYAQLDRQSRALAGRLRARGISPGDVVAVAMERSAGAIVAVLGVLKAGAAYLPLDLKHPAERLAFMLQDASATVVLVGDADTCMVPGSVQRIVVDATQTGGDESGSAAEPEDDAIGDGESLAYVMYTSGSTGQPKGVEIRHRSILRLVCGVDYIELGLQTRFLHAAPLGFDASTLEIWGALLNGGCVVVHGEATPTGTGLATCIAGHDVTTAWLTAALFNAVVDEDPRQLAGLRELFTGGEALSVAHVRRMLAAAPGTRLHNGYGPTECTTFTCTWEIPVDFPADAANVPIGRPIANTRVYVLNTRREPVPVGVIGELYVGGEGLARGYLNQPGLTGERFVPDPFGAPGERLYRTGDQVRYRPDGIIEFVGRVDTQVKIRGFRIELAEIEAALASHPSIRACAVLACTDQTGDKRLVAYCVAVPQGFSEPALRAYLAAKLPEFMLPARYVRMDSLPVTANGKLDRRALPAPDRSRPELACAYEPPVDDVERRICRAFSELLDIDQVGRHDNFFELGGNSLLGLRLLEMIRLAGSAAGIPATTLFHSPTAATLSKAIEGRDGAAIDPSRLARRVRPAGHDAADDPIADDPIAIVGMAGRFPGAADVEAFWQNLCEGRDSITVFGLDGLDPAVSEADRA
ncbi:MAG TPA: amino acid adenylation domain-containing protein, partial [Lysobacter sp.]|nr:amino acid adenylation domain-containing protein [Lysobacter sp.]